MLQIDHLIITRKDWKNVIPEDRFLLLKNDLQKNHDIYKETFLYLDRTGDFLLDSFVLNSILARPVKIIYDESS